MATREVNLRTIHSQIHALVHCHICPMKGCCRVSAEDASWRWHHEGEVRGRDYEHSHIILAHENDWRDLNMATQNCPLRKLLESVIP